jgi:uncharacterized membrane protein YphA (DoxX/SURF4 family)
MNQLAPIGRLFFAVALIAFGVQQFVYGDFVPGRAPVWPASVPGRLVWAYLTGAVFVAAGAAIISGKKARAAALLAGALIFLWALLRHLPLIAADPQLGSAWTKAGKALALVGGALAVAGSVRAGASSASGGANDKLILAGRVALGLFMILAGVQHFLFADFVKALVPAWIPGSLFWTYFSAVALIAGGAGLILPVTARLAAALSGVMIFLWVLMLHIPRAATIRDANETLAVFEALAMSGIAFVIAGFLSQRER